MDDMSMEGICMHSNPALVSLYCTCMRSSTRLMSALITEGDLVDVVATLVNPKPKNMINVLHEDSVSLTYLNRPRRKTGLKSFSPVC